MKIFCIALLIPLILVSHEHSSEKTIDSIDVSSYPAAMQERYQVFSRNCSSCHGLDDPIEFHKVLPSIWVDTVEDMKLKSKSKISDQDAALILEFLIYDSAKRRKTELDEQMQKLDDTERKKEQALLEGVLNKFSP